MMRTWLFVVLSVLLLASVAFAQEFEYNKTQWATCQKGDAFDAYFYHAPYVEGIVVDGDATDWNAYPGIEWANVDNFCAGRGQESWSTENGGWNWPSNGPEDFSCKFKSAWTMKEEFPVWLILIDWTDDEFDWCALGEGCSWNNTDIFQCWYVTQAYDLTAPMTTTQLNEEYGFWAWQQINVFGIPGFGCRFNGCADGTAYCADEANQPYSVGEFEQISNTKANVEVAVQLFDTYAAGEPWIVTPGESNLAIGIGGCNDYDPSDGSFTYMTWGFSHRDNDANDFRTRMSTVGFEKSYNQLFFGQDAVEGTTWGAIKSAF